MNLVSKCAARSRKVHSKSLQLLLGYLLVLNAVHGHSPCLGQPQQLFKLDRSSRPYGASHMRQTRLGRQDLHQLVLHVVHTAWVELAQRILDGLLVLGLAVVDGRSEDDLYLAQLLAVSLHRRGVFATLSQFRQRVIDLLAQPPALLLDAACNRLHGLIVALRLLHVLRIGVVDLGDHKDQLLDRTTAQQRKNEVLFGLAIGRPRLGQEQHRIHVFHNVLRQVYSEALWIV
ncbi:hypothetical protein FQZ97_896120 [compost metagenome]